MAAIEIAKDLFFIERGYLNGNHFVYRSRDAVLVDTAYAADVGETERRLKDLGVAFSDVRRIVNTHCHCDHVGGNRAVQERSGCDIAMHRIGKHFIDARDDWATWWRYYAQQAEFFDCTQALEDGEAIPVGPHEFRVVHAPGHSADGIVLYDRKDRILISSDSLWENDVPVMTLRIEGSGSLFTALESLEKIEALGAKTVYPGHGRPFVDVGAAIEKARAKITGYLADPRRIGDDLLKKIVVYTLLMKKSVPEETFFGALLSTAWFRETVDLYFGGDYEGKYRDAMDALLGKGAVARRDGFLSTPVRP